MVVYAPDGRGLRPVAKVTALSRIAGLEVRNLVGGNTAEVVVEDEYNEVLGAFYRHRAVVLLKWRNGALEVVWAGVREKEQYSLDPPMAEREVIRSDVRFAGRTIHVRSVTTLESRDERGDYRQTSRREDEQHFRWNPWIFRFVEHEPR